ncbi:MAG TPA: L,D-transpeptidase [Lamprocystis sp. (in: g-proteobacteria)]|nr:L,D-transpeptidase [Lamprocystis sp. (in: g-proteobacteria)]
MNTLHPLGRPARTFRLGLPTALLAAPLALHLAGCTELNRFIARPEAKPPGATPQVAAQPAQPAVPQTPEPIPTAQEKPKPGKLYEWSGDGRAISHIVVNVDEQKARFYEGEEQIGWTTVASGVSTHPTPVGRFEVLEKVANKRSNLYGKVYGRGGSVVRSDAKSGRDPIPAGARFEGAKMPYFLRVTYDGVGLHAGPIPRPGRPASHGCIRLPAPLAPVLFQHVGVGTKVSIVGQGPDYGNYAEKQRAIVAERSARERERREIAARLQAKSPAGGPLIAQVEPVGGTPSLGSDTATPARSPAPVPEPTAQPAASAQPAVTRPARVAAAPAQPRATPRPRSASRPQVRRQPTAAPAPAVTTVAQNAAPIPVEPSAPAAAPTTPPAPPVPASPVQAVTTPTPAAATPSSSPPVEPAAPPAPTKPVEPAPAAASAPVAPAKPAEPAPVAPPPAPAVVPSAPEQPGTPATPTGTQT